MENEAWHTFHKIKKMNSEITQNKDCDQNLETRVVCALSTFDLDVALEQRTTDGWVAIAYALYVQ